MTVKDKARAFDLLESAEASMKVAGFTIKLGDPRDSLPSIGDAIKELRRLRDLVAQGVGPD